MDNLAKMAKTSAAWNNFVKGQTFDEKNVRPVILESWKRSKSYAVSVPKARGKMLEGSELDKRIEKNKLMIDTAFHYMQTLYDVVRGSGFVVLLSDKDGYVLKLIGDEDMVHSAESNFLIEGANRSEESMGTNAIGTCLFLHEQIQISADEHYTKQSKNWTCSAAPIKDRNGDLQGCLCISGNSQNVHLHTLGMVVAAAGAIEKEIQMHYAINEIKVMNNQLSATINSISYGLIVVNHRNLVTHINSLAKTILDIEDRDVINKHIHSILIYDTKLFDLQRLSKNIYDKEVNLELPNENIVCSLSATLIKDNDAYSGYVITLKEIRFIHDLVNKMTGSRALYSFKDIIGSSLAINEAVRLSKIASGSSSNVLLTGESGTGKELFAQAIHNNSDKREGPFLAINCGALPRGLIESELFGYEGGSFTGARKEGRPGKFELANGGTLFLDEIGDMPLDIQVMLLRVLQDKHITRIGGKNAIDVDVRIIAATNKDLLKSIEDKTFREDLFYRLNVFSINIAALRHRGTDVLDLINYFFRKYAVLLQKPVNKISEDVYAALMNYDWPGNVRELENIIERALNVAQPPSLELYDLPSHFGSKAGHDNNTFKEKSFPITGLNIKEAEKDIIIKAIKENRGNLKKAAEALGISRRTMYRKAENFGIDYAEFR